MTSITFQSEPRANAKYMQIVKHLAAQIRSWHLRPGECLPTFVELQQQFGVTSPTVNRAMIALEQQGLVERKRGSGIYVCDWKNVKRARHAGNSHIVIGLAGFGFQFGGRSSYWTTLLAGVRDEAAKRQAQIVLLDWDSSAGWEQADGIIICDWTNQKTLRRVPPELPCVSVMVAVEGMASVAADDYAGTREATEHLLKLGHRRIAYLHGPEHTATARRSAGYHDALKAAHIKPQQKWERLLLWKDEQFEDFVQAGEETMTTWLEDGWKKTGCTALLCQNDAAAVGAAVALRTAGLRVPHDVSLVGFDGSEISEYHSPRLTTVALPLREIGARVMRLLNRQIENDQVCADHEILAPQLFLKESTVTPPTRFTEGAN